MSGHRVCRVPGVLETEVDGDRVLLAPATMTFVGLNPVGARIWALVGTHPVDVASIVATLTDEYDVDEATCRRQVEAFVARAVDAQVLRAAP